MYDELRTMLSHHFPWHKSRLTALAHILYAILDRRTVNLAHLAPVAFVGKTKIPSCYRRLQRLIHWIARQDGAQACYRKAILKCLLGPHILTLDRTHWKWGQRDINALVLGVVVARLTIPLAWKTLPRAGNSHTEDRQLMIEALLKDLDAKLIDILLCDREFIGKDWFQFLIKKKIPFGIRIKKGQYGECNNYGRTSTMTLDKMFCKAQQGRIKVRKHVLMGGIPLHLASTRSPTGEPVLVATNKGCARKALEQYRIRWATECLFQNFKSRGFNLEDTHITDPHRIDALILILGLLTMWSLKVGIYQSEEQPMLSTYQRKRRSFFRLGMDLLIRSMHAAKRNLDRVYTYIQLFAEPPIFLKA